MSAVTFEVQDGDLPALQRAKNRLDNQRLGLQNNIDGAATAAQRQRAVSEIEAADAVLRVIRAAVFSLTSFVVGNAVPVSEVAPSVAATAGLIVASSQGDAVVIQTGPGQESGTDIAKAGAF